MLFCQASYNKARPHLMATMDFVRDSTPFFGAAVRQLSLQQNMLIIEDEATANSHTPRSTFRYAKFLFTQLLKL